ncbi:MAG: glycosyltransferase 87 family protein, partial [Gemmataceae bacterium]
MNGLICGLSILTIAIRRDFHSGMEGRQPYDFAHYYLSSKRIHNGENPNLPVANEVRDLLDFDGYKAHVADPPGMLLIQYPIGFFSYSTSWLACALASIFVLTGSIFLVCKELKLPLHITLGSMGLSLLSYPFQESLFYNHSEWILLVLSVLGWIFARRGKPLGGFLWGMLASAKLFPGMLLVTCFTSRLWKLFAWTFLGFTIFTIAGVLLIGTNRSLDFINLALPQSKLYYNRVGNSSLMALGNIVTGHLWVGFILTFLGALACLACSWKYPGNLDRVYCSGISSALILSPISWIPYGILMFPPLIILSTKINWKSIGQSCLFILLSSIMIFWPIYFHHSFD